MQLDEEARKIFKDIDADRKQAKHFLLYFNEEWKKYKQERTAYISFNGRHNELESHNPTERIAVRGADFDRNSEKFRWLRAVRILEQGMLENEQAFLRARRAAAKIKGRNFHSGRPGWVIYTQQKYYDAMEKKTCNGNYWLSEQQIKRWWKKIVSRTADIAVRLRNDEP